ncbi:ATP synthase subunit I [Leptothrix discophora]|uniref:ATP synthase subunit I n=1 Tax=Leptothrix discophora TaxID=89 RepID=A0ABT9G4A3_LEPDI|nr:ATP synthase subunit I [Leptothrix discophora]MDP4301313.1 ATP synthase subunit I [Leptothrix discophora]
MSTVSREPDGEPDKAWRDSPVDPNEAEEPIKVWTREEVLAMRSRHPLLSPWRVVAAQAAAGCLLAIFAWLLADRQEVVWSALYGSAAVVLPNALMARGMGRLQVEKAGAAAFGFMVWEFAKVALTVAMLAAAVKVVPDLSWPALLVAVVVCLKMNWLALLLQGWKIKRSPDQRSSTHDGC